MEGVKRIMKTSKNPTTTLKGGNLSQALDASHHPPPTAPTPDSESSQKGSTLFIKTTAFTSTSGSTADLLRTPYKCVETPKEEAMSKRSHISKETSSPNNATAKKCVLTSGKIMEIKRPAEQPKGNNGGKFRAGRKFRPLKKTSTAANLFVEQNGRSVIAQGIEEQKENGSQTTRAHPKHMAFELYMKPGRSPVNRVEDAGGREKEFDFDVLREMLHIQNEEQLSLFPVLKIRLPGSCAFALHDIEFIAPL